MEVSVTQTTTTTFKIAASDIHSMSLLKMAFEYYRNNHQVPPEDLAVYEDMIAKLGQAGA